MPESLRLTLAILCALTGCCAVMLWFIHRALMELVMRARCADPDRRRPWH